MSARPSHFSVNTQFHLQRSYKRVLILIESSETSNKFQTPCSYPNKEYNMQKRPKFKVNDLKILQENHPYSTAILFSQILFQIKQLPVRYSFLTKKTPSETQYICNVSIRFIKPTETRLLKLKQYPLPVERNCF